MLFNMATFNTLCKSSEDTVIFCRMYSLDYSFKFYALACKEIYYALAFQPNKSHGSGDMQLLKLMRIELASARRK